MISFVRKEKTKVIEDSVQKGVKVEGDVTQKGVKAAERHAEQWQC